MPLRPVLPEADIERGRSVRASLALCDGAPPPIKPNECQIGAKQLERETDTEHLDRIERKFGIEAAFDVGSLPETVLLAFEQEITSQSRKGGGRGGQAAPYDHDPPGDQWDSKSGKRRLLLARHEESPKCRGLRFPHARGSRPG